MMQTRSIVPNYCLVLVVDFFLYPTVPFSIKFLSIQEINNNSMLPRTFERGRGRENIIVKCGCFSESSVWKNQPMSASHFYTRALMMLRLGSRFFLRFHHFSVLHAFTTPNDLIFVVFFRLNWYKHTHSIYTLNHNSAEQFYIAFDGIY